MQTSIILEPIGLYIMCIFKMKNNLMIRTLAELTQVQPPTNNDIINENIATVHRYITLKSELWYLYHGNIWEL